MVWSKCMGGCFYLVKISMRILKMAIRPLETTERMIPIYLTIYLSNMPTSLWLIIK